MRVSLLRRVLLVLIVSYAASATGVATELQSAPDWTLSTSDGQAINLIEESEQQTVVLFFWATWCPYCKALMPHLQSMRFEYGDNIKILAVNIFEDADPVAFMTDAGYDFTLLPDGDAVAELYGTHATPGVFVIDADCAIRFNLRTLPRISPPDNGEKAGHSRKAAFLAPYWAAEIRKSIDQIEGKTPQ
jgi:thiol-disulfide isomerase/thioredoxin